MSKQEVQIEDIADRYENPIAELVRVACQFSSTIMLADDEHRVNAKSIMGIMAFAPAGGKSVSIETSGEDEDMAAQAMANFLLCTE
ncbi:MAG: HPr family phosphocarrier protein [Clostridiales bacterium]|nr:HPr family phosphocarrier protein [Clostridiales bacterium]MCD8109873.1 HPr family phosphocarrier protein [Clostridiales bacterium]MCD8132635.1 HPr family phosphocarrier protein [Clostridiales bacterium]